MKYRVNDAMDLSDDEKDDVIESRFSFCSESVLSNNFADGKISNLLNMMNNLKSDDKDDFDFKNGEEVIATLQDQIKNKVIEAFFEENHPASNVVKRDVIKAIEYLIRNITRKKVILKKSSKSYDQFKFTQMKKKYSPHPVYKILEAGKQRTKILSSEKLFPGEKNIHSRRIIAFIVKLVEESQELCEVLLTTTHKSQKKPLIDCLCEKISKSFKRKIKEHYYNSGFTQALSELLLAITKHYEEYQNVSLISPSVYSFAFLVLKIGGWDQVILTNLIASITNILQCSATDLPLKLWLSARVKKSD
jgi:hypothetical protein